MPVAAAGLLGEAEGLLVAHHPHVPSSLTAGGVAFLKQAIPSMSILRDAAQKACKILWLQLWLPKITTCTGSQPLDFLGDLLKALTSSGASLGRFRARRRFATHEAGPLSLMYPWAKSH